MSDEVKKCSIVVFSGDMDKVFAGFIIATTAAAMGMETSMFFTFWGLKAIQKGNLTGKGLFGRMIGLMNRGGINTIGPSRFNFGGIGRWMFKKMMRDKGVTPLEELRQAAIDLDVRLLACQMSLDVMEITREDLIDEVEDCVGAATYVAEAMGAEITLFI
ncbi:MAG: DsrE/DsrF/DrsH-like family protein [Chloroflexi bacterium]|nr:DsrE/DsrF/DrsH-like family protein [Chloroflexota bacterium]MBU1747634.1 DsrE/DsrF/DrsH-like family protein [Chloroflexota bacterium]MBU1878646.1 DsrE/DsrF/DrsH-like family protein [Chloroflexota bacterium]